MNKHVFNFLALLKNAAYHKKQIIQIEIGTSHVFNIANKLYREGLISSIKNISGKKYEITLSKFEHNINMRNMKIISTPLKFHYISYKDILRVSFKNITYFVCTSNGGILTGTECKRFHTGGIFLFMC